MKPTAFIYGVLILAAMTLCSGVVYGHLSRRWGGSRDMQPIVDQLNALPKVIGDWHMQNEQPLASSVAATLESIGYVGRQYENEKTGELVSMFVLLGPAGPVSVHTPEVCYSSQDYSVYHKPTHTKPITDENAQDELWATTLQALRLDSTYLRVYYGWSTGGPWAAPNDARFTYAGKPYLYKLQVAGTIPSPAEQNTSDPGLSFIKALLPILKQYLVEPVKE